MSDQLDPNEIEYEDPPPRLPRGYLEFDVDRIIRSFDAGEFTLPEGRFLTPYAIATKLVEEADGERKRPSNGAIANVLRRMERAGYAVLRANPNAFVSLEMKGRLMPSWQVYQDNFPLGDPDNDG